ncbi:HAD-IA family hydrolase [Pseudomonas sp.]|uniref:HAD-IA family hydrolase n=1 Tax=Pseudomonas sp. TaxID=306 RepID=UPI00258AA392|nr:HAD-IA family hydrolase [Pseudomonas sp.]
MLGLPPSDCLAVEDAPAGLRAAHAAGCQVLAVTALSGERWSNDLHGLEVLG